MDPVVIILIVYSALSTLLHGYRLKKSKCRTNPNSCLFIDTEFERKASSNSVSKPESQQMEDMKISPSDFNISTPSLPIPIENIGVKVHIPKSI